MIATWSQKVQICTWYFFCTKLNISLYLYILVYTWDISEVDHWSRRFLVGGNFFNMAGRWSKELCRGQSAGWYCTVIYVGGDIGVAEVCRRSSAKVK